MIKRILFSTRTMGLLLIVYALSMAAATFVENDYGTPVAKELIYNSWWFEAVMVLLVANFMGNIVRYKLYKRPKWPLLVFHLAFLFIFLGGAITRYISFEGSMHIREGEMDNRVISEATFFKVQFANSATVKNFQQQTNFIPNNSPAFFRLFKSRFSADYEFENQKVNFKLINFVPRAQDSVLADPTGQSIIHLVAMEAGVRKNIYIPSGGSKALSGVEVGFNKTVTDGVSITEDNNGELSIISSFPGRYMVMATQASDTIQAINTKEPFHLRSLYNINMGPVFVVPEPPKKGRLLRIEGDVKKDAFAPDLIVMAVKTDNKVDTIEFYGGKGSTDYQASMPIKDFKVAVGYGSRYYYSPFYIHLNRFELDKYPGSNSPSSFASEVTVIDGPKSTPFRIYMNHILDYKGFRFFQSSYDNDEKGTVLSVNHDETGTMMTYIGYFMLFFGMFVTLFWKGTRFNILNQQLKAMSKKAVVILILIFASVQMTMAQTIDKKHAEAFGYLPVQNIDGRIEPANTLALEILRKLYRHDDYDKLDANQFLLSVTTSPMDWLTVPLIKVNKRGGSELLKTVKANEDGFTSIINLLRVDTSGGAEFLLQEEYNKSFAKKAADQDNYDKEIIELNDKMQAAQWLVNGLYLRVIPVRGDANHTWEAIHFMQEPTTPGQSLVSSYFASVQEAKTSGNWSKPDQLLAQLKQLQLAEAKSIMPAQSKIDIEVWFNGWNMFFKLMIFYSIIGGILLLMSFIALFNRSKAVKNIILSLIASLAVAAAIQTFGLGVRWYISGHAPWSNGYEAVMFISLIGLVSGLFLYRNSNSFIPTAGALIAVILMGFAHGGAQMNPQMTPLVPVLKSYWLMIHVAIITSSYGFFGLSALLGAVVLLLHIVNNKERKQIIETSMRELTIVNELSLTIGLFMLTIGTFLGGMWANESWGRYWSWDPKETWAFISVIFYAFVLHVRLIPGLGSKFLFNFLSLICFSTVIMTYFGVNYYLSGLHSYAKGDPMPIPSWIYITIGAITVLTLAALYRYKKLMKQ